MHGWGEDQRTHTEKTRDALTSSKKTKIKTLIGKCEACNKKFDPAHLDVHHISEAAKADGTTDKNAPGNLICLCPTCHRIAHSGKITKTELRSIVRDRSDLEKKELKAILRNRPLVTDDTGGSIFNSNPRDFLSDDAYAFFVGGEEKPKRKKKTGTTQKKKKKTTNNDDLIFPF
jgi:hypothetical protein